jgi:hypothetical protein
MVVKPPRPAQARADGGFEWAEARGRHQEPARRGARGSANAMAIVLPTRSCRAAHVD